MVAGNDMSNAGADGLDDSGTLVAEDDRDGEGDRAIDDGQVAVAQTCGGHGDPHLAWSGITDFQVVDHLDLFPVEDHTSHDLSPLFPVALFPVRSAGICECKPRSC
jgi:hypothetical protein